MPTRVWHDLTACWKAQLRLAGWHVRAERAEVHQVLGCLVSVGVLERERHDRGLPIDTLKHELSGHGPTSMLPALERLTQAA